MQRSSTHACEHSVYSVSQIMGVLKATPHNRAKRTVLPANCHKQDGLTPQIIAEGALIQTAR